MLKKEGSAAKGVWVGLAVMVPVWAVAVWFLVR